MSDLTDMALDALRAVQRSPRINEWLIWKGDEDTMRKVQKAVWALEAERDDPQ